ncbi:CACTA en-spm transposon protein [Cucumis melo var. makuwa]|uniref:CACTA en-spm transposon protein n=1 Tax=Cucumis melo var. makuwa TaxID=1194695 RepID=A0A5D3D498_CUCMM|nr:CACTA en-spm transposon protein [Cucumis melo var. makuwa]
MFLQFEDDLYNIAGGSSSVGDNTRSSSQQTTPTPRRRAQSRLLELERHVAINGRIPMTIAPGAEKPISPHAVRFSQMIGVCVRKTFFVHCLKWGDVGREYIEVVKGDLQKKLLHDFSMSLYKETGALKVDSWRNPGFVEVNIEARCEFEKLYDTFNVFNGLIVIFNKWKDVICKEKMS